MKKIILSFIVALVSTTFSNAQISKIINQEGTKTILKKITTTFPDAVFFEQPNYQGQSGNISFSAGVIKLPFLNKKHLSMQVPQGKIVYVKYCSEFPYEMVYSESVVDIDLTMVCGIRSDVRSGFNLDFNGFTTDIHNNDCKKMFGNVAVKVVETAPDGTSVFIPYNVGTALRTADKFTFNPFTRNKADSRVNFENFVFDKNQTPIINSIVKVKSDGGDDIAGYAVGESAIRDGRVKFVFTINIASAHKGGEAALDFCPNVHMERPVVKEIPINYMYDGNKLVNAQTPKIILGPFAASGSPDNKVMASGGIYKNFGVQFTVAGLR